MHTDKGPHEGVSRMETKGTLEVLHRFVMLTSEPIEVAKCTAGLGTVFVNLRTPPSQVSKFVVFTFYKQKVRVQISFSEPVGVRSEELVR